MTGPGSWKIEIRPLARNPGSLRRLAVLGAILLVCALGAGVRLEQAWETGLRKGNFGDFPLPILIALTVAVGAFAPLSFVGLAALAFAEETVEVADDCVTIRTTTFERTRSRRIPLRELDGWTLTFYPLPPWWTWTVQRLAARSGGRLEPVAAAAGPREKRAIAQMLAQATGKPLEGGRRGR